MLQYIQHDPVTEFVSILVFSILGSCLLWEVYSLLKTYKVYKDNALLLRMPDASQKLLNLSPLKPQADGVKVVRSYPKFLQLSPERSKIRYFTTVLTSLGVLGTFLGIMAGLDDIDKKLAGDTAQTFNAVKDLLGGMSTAFVTSIVGMVSSLTLLCALSVCDKFKHRWHRNLFEVFHQNYRIETLGDYLNALSGERQQELLEMQLEVARKGEHASDALLDMGRSLQKSAENFNADKIGEHISKSLDSVFRAEMVPIFSAISSELSALREIKQDNGEAIIDAIKKEIVIPLTAEIHNTAGMVAQAAGAINKLNEDLGSISTNLGESVAIIQAFQKETMVDLQNFADDLRKILLGFQTDTKQILEGVAVSIQSAVQQSISGMSAQRDAFKVSAIEAAKTFKDIKTELMQALEHQAGLQKNLLVATANSFDSAIQTSITAFEKQTGVLQNVGEHAAKLMESSKDNLELTLGNIEQSLLKTKLVVENELQLFRTNYQASLTEFFEQQNNLLDNTLGSQRDGLAKVVADCDAIFKEEYKRRKELSADLGTSLTDMQQAVEIVSTLVQSVRMLDAAYVNTIEQAASSIGRQLAGFEKQHHATQQVLSQFMQQVPEALNGYFAKANDSHVKFFNGMDEAATRIHQRLLQSAEYLVSAQITKQQFELEKIS